MDGCLAKPYLVPAAAPAAAHASSKGKVGRRLLSSSPSRDEKAWKIASAHSPQPSPDSATTLAAVADDELLPLPADNPLWAALPPGQCGWLLPAFLPFCHWDEGSETGPLGVGVGWGWGSGAWVGCLRGYAAASPVGSSTSRPNGLSTIMHRVLMRLNPAFHSLPPTSNAVTTASTEQAPLPVEGPTLSFSSWAPSIELHYVVVYPPADIFPPLEHAAHFPSAAPASTPAAPPASPSVSRAAGLPGRALCSCKGADSKLTCALASLAHSLPHHQRRQPQAAPRQLSLGLELTGAEAMWLVNADAADWTLPACTEDAGTAVAGTASAAVAADAQLMPTMTAIHTTATPVGSGSVLRHGRWFASAQRRLAGGLAAARSRMTCLAPCTKG